MVLVTAVALITVSSVAQSDSDYTRRVLDFLFQYPSAYPGPTIPVRNSALRIYDPVEPIPVVNQELQLNHVLRTTDGLFVFIEGTGRVYQVRKTKGNGYQFDRIDSTRHFGYNHGAFVFTHRDTIFSLGGYGFWQYNGQLRFYQPESAGWAIQQLNRRVQVRRPDLGIFADHRNSAVWYINRGNKEEDLNLSAQKSIPKEEMTVFRLDLNRKEWKSMGKVSGKFLPMAAEANVIGSLPTGRLILINPTDEPQITLADYAGNRILKLADPVITKQIEQAIKGVDNLFRFVPVTVYQNDTLHILSGAGNRLHIPMTLNDFQPLGISIYEPFSGNADSGSTLRANENESSEKVMRSLAIGLGCGLALGFIFFRRRKSVMTEEVQDKDTFTKRETKVLKAFLEKSDGTLSVEEMDELLETNSRSRDVQNQKRSALTRSINQKYNLLTNDPENLIETRRQEFDRRMIRYELNQSKFSAIRDRVNGT